MRQGDSQAAGQAYEEAYQELRIIARRLLRNEYGRNVSPTELVNETYLRHLHRGTVLVENRQHFYGIAAQAMRHVLIDLARQRQTARRGGGASVLPLDHAGPVAALASSPDEMLSLEAHLKELEKLDPPAAQVFSMRFFLGQTGDEAAGILGRDASGVRRDWEYAKAWLRDRITHDLSQSAKRSAK
jgi:RNA polymerase sigma factor (TIGR02999 family)